MSVKNTLMDYGSVSKWLHWGVFLLVLVTVPLGYTMFSFQDKALKGQLINILDILTSLKER